MICPGCGETISPAEQKVMSKLKFDKCVKCRQKLENEKNRIETISQRNYDKKYPQQFGKVVESGESRE